MKDNDLLILAVGGVILYLLYENSMGASAAQAAINQTNLNAANTVNNTGIIAGAATGISQDLQNIANAF